MVVLLASMHIAHSELRNVNSFTRSKIFKPNFTPRKTRKSQNFGYFLRTKLTKSMILEDKCLQLYQIGLVLLRKLAYQSCIILSKKAWFCKIACSPKLYIPTCRIFLQEYIRHILDIWQLWKSRFLNVYSGWAEELFFSWWIETSYFLCFFRTMSVENVR